MSNRTAIPYSMRSFGSYIARHKYRFTIVITSYVIADFLIAIIPIFIGRLVGALAARPFERHAAIVYVVLLIICSSGHNLMWRVSEFLYMKLVNPLGYLYENILFQKIIRMPYPYFIDKFTGKIASYVNTISQELRELIQNLCYNYTTEVVNLVTVSVILFTINWQTGVIFLLAVLLMFMVGRHTIKNSNRYEKQSADIQSTKNGKIIDAIANFVNVKSFQKEEREIDTIRSEQQKTIQAANKSFFWSIIFWSSMSFFVRDLIWPLTIIFNVYLFLHHELSITDLTTMLSTILIFSSSVWEAIWYISQFNLKLARVEEAHTYLFGNVNIVKQYQTERLRKDEPRHLKHTLTIEHLSFAYPDKQDVTVLKDISLNLSKGEKVGIVGKSGSGKTTLTKLLLGYYPVGDRQILLDSKPIDTQDLARLISFVPQDTSLFYRTIAENIAYATDHTVSRSDIVRAAQKAHADEFIRGIYDGYDALVGERGVKLSAGQRQRIAIARAILDNKPILIMDEATSALDSESEVLVQQALETLWQDKTVIAIAHRLSTLRHMDRIVVVDKGRIVEQGTHTELLKQKGTYAKLWVHQSGGFIED